MKNIIQRDSLEGVVGKKEISIFKTMIDLVTKKFFECFYTLFKFLQFSR